MADSLHDLSRQPVARRRIVQGIGGAFVAVSNIAPGWAKPAGGSKRFAFASPDVPEGFLLDGKPLQIRAGEMHPPRIPAEYWRHRIRMAKAMGLNTIAVYDMWNHHEVEPGQFDFSTGNRDLGGFMKLCAAEGMKVFLRPGPYVCAEWELGGIPGYLLRNPKAELRQRSDRAYMQATERYIKRVADIIRPLMADKGGPILMVQVENEYASFGKDVAYLEEIRDMWVRADITGPFSIADGLGQLQSAGTYVPGTAIGLNGSEDFAAARTIDANAPIWITEAYSGWLTHWGDPKFQSADYREKLRKLMAERRSFNIYVVHGGTNFGFTAGSNANGDGSKFEPSLTSYDYGAPINECGRPSAQYTDMRRIIHDALGQPEAPIPAPPPLIAFDAVTTRPQGSLWGALSSPKQIATPQPMEFVFGQTAGMILYRHRLPAGAGGMLRIDGLHDEALVLVDGKPVGRLTRLIVENGANKGHVAIPASSIERALDILVYAFGRVNYGHYMHDRKGIIGAVTLAARPLNGWEAYSMPLDEAHLKRALATKTQPGGLLHGATFRLTKLGDTFIDMAQWKRGFVWVNGHLLGRHCELGPQTRLYCPQSWLKLGENRITVLDLYATGGTIRGVDQSDTMAKEGAKAV